MHDSIDQQLGPNIRKYRHNQALSIGVFAKKAGLSKSMVSKIERGLASPSVASLRRIASTLNVSVPSILKSIGNFSKVSSESPLSLNFKIYDEGCNEKGFTDLSGSKCGLVLHGELMVSVEDDEYYLKQGDSITIGSSLKYSINNLSAIQSVCIWADYQKLQ